MTAPLLVLCETWHRNHERLHASEGAVRISDLPALITESHRLDKAIAETPATSMEGLKAKAGVFRACGEEVSMTGPSLLSDLIRELLA